MSMEQLTATVAALLEEVGGINRRLGMLEAQVGKLSPAHIALVSVVDDLTKVQNQTTHFIKTLPENEVVLAKLMQNAVLFFNAHQDIMIKEGRFAFDVQWSDTPTCDESLRVDLRVDEPTLVSVLKDGEWIATATDSEAGNDFVSLVELTAKEAGHVGPKTIYATYNYKPKDTEVDDSETVELVEGELVDENVQFH